MISDSSSPIIFELMSLSDINVGWCVSYSINREQRAWYGVGSFSHISLIKYYDFCVIKKLFWFLCCQKAITIFVTALRTLLAHISLDSPKTHLLRYCFEGGKRLTFLIDHGQPTHTKILGPPLTGPHRVGLHSSSACRRKFSTGSNAFISFWINRYLSKFHIRYTVLDWPCKKVKSSTQSLFQLFKH